MNVVSSPHHKKDLSPFVGFLGTKLFLFRWNNLKSNTGSHATGYMGGCPGNTHLIPHRIVGSLLSACLLYVLATGHLHHRVKTTPHKLTSLEDVHPNLEVSWLVGKLLTLATSLLATSSTSGNEVTMLCEKLDPIIIYKKPSQCLLRAHLCESCKRQKPNLEN